MYDYDRNGPRAKRALLEGGPIGRALMKTWNELHDMEHDLKQTERDYGDAAHFMGGPAQHAAQEMVKKIESVVKQIDSLASNVLVDLTDHEEAFVEKFGEPKVYADQMRKKVFPRAAAAPKTKADFTKIQHQMSADLDTFEMAWSRYEKDPVANKHKLDDAMKYMKDLHELSAVLLRNMEQLKAG